MGRMSGAVRCLQRPSDHRRKVDMLRIWRTDAIATDRAAANTTKTAAELRKSGGQGRDRTGDLPLFQADAHTD